MKPSKELDDDSFLIANLDFSAFYRVNYDTENWKLIIKQLDTNDKVIYYIYLLTSYLIYCYIVITKAIILENQNTIN